MATAREAGLAGSPTGRLTPHRWRSFKAPSAYAAPFAKVELLTWPGFRGQSEHEDPRTRSGRRGGTRRSATLPEGTRVVVFQLSPVDQERQPGEEAAELPLVSGGEPGSLDLTNDRIYELLDEEDIRVDEANLGCTFLIPSGQRTRRPRGRSWSEAKIVPGLSARLPATYTTSGCTAIRIVSTARRTVTWQRPCVQYTCTIRFPHTPAGILRRCGKA